MCILWLHFRGSRGRGFSSIPITDPKPDTFVYCAVPTNACVVQYLALEFLCALPTQILEHEGGGCGEGAQVPHGLLFRLPPFPD